MKIKMLDSRIHRYLRNQHSKKKKLTCEGKREGRQHNTASAVRSGRIVCFARPDESDGSSQMRETKLLSVKELHHR